jgi:MFS family permease
MNGFGLIPVTIAAVFICGAVLGIMASLCVPLAKRLGVPEGRAYVFSVILNLSFVPMTVLSGYFIDQYGVEWVLIGASLVIATGVAALALSRHYLVGLALIALVAMASGGLIVAGNILMPKAFFPALVGVDPKNSPSAAFNLGNVFFVLGTLLAPPLANMAINRFGFRRTLGLVALACLLPAVIAALTDAREYPLTTGRSPELLFSKLAIWLAAMIFLFYGPVENIGVTFASSWFKELGYRSRGRTLIQSGFWTSFLASRLLAAYLLEHDLVRPPWVWLVLIPALVAAILLVNLAGIAGRGAAPWGFILFGLVLGPIMPTMLGTVYSTRAFREDVGLALGTMYAAGALGTLLLVPAMAWSARRSSAQRSLAIPALMALLLGGVVLALHLA